MSGLRRFERRWKAWIRMRNDMHWRSYDAQRNSIMRTMARVGLSTIMFILSAMATMVIASCTAPTSAHAADQIPANAARYKLTLRREAHRVWGLDAPIATFGAQIHQESRWRPDAVSPVGALGLAQFMPATAAWISGLYADPETGLQAQQPANPTWSIRALVTYDWWLWQRIRADTSCERMAYVLSAYNGGLGWVYKRQARSLMPGQCIGHTCAINPGIHPASQRENELYPRLILIRFEPLYTTWGKGACQ